MTSKKVELPGLAYQELLNAAPDAILVVDRSGKIVWANQHCGQLFDYELEELVQLPVEALVPSEVRGGHAALRQSYDQEPKLRPMGSAKELYGLRKDHQTVPVEISLSPMDEGAAPDQGWVIVVVRDVSEQRRISRRLASVNRSLERSNRELEQFAYVASHDLQEPLRMIAGFGQLLRQRYADRLDDVGREFLSDMHEGVQRMEQLIQDLLQFSRLTLDPARFETVAMNDVAKQVAQVVGQRLAEAGGSLEISDLPAVRGHRSQLVRLLTNLLTNAIKFRHQDRLPKIAIDAHEEDQWIRISVTDNGRGIDPADFDQVFVIFRRLAGTEDVHGTGIGLAACKKIIENHGGEIWVESAGDNGCTFHFTLPKAKLSAQSK